MGAVIAALHQPRTKPSDLKYLECMKTALSKRQLLQRLSSTCLLLLIAASCQPVGTVHGGLSMHEPNVLGGAALAEIADQPQGSQARARARVAPANGHVFWARSLSCPEQHTMNQTDH